MIKKQLSFNDRLQAGATKEELMKYYYCTDAQYEKTIACLDKIHAGVKA